MGLRRFIDVAVILQKVCFAPVDRVANGRS